ncbi:hypothetical protein IWX90DRAFT_35695 [Phyllosticta citrichinensis]|uniref:Uncharacterized protein n=1 Tax=Phyllosticta citrichinensis TaxID=1130410 RepID=A0ABR1Y8C9_9PEZI
MIVVLLLFVVPLASIRKPRCRERGRGTEDVFQQRARRSGGRGRGRAARGTARQPARRHGGCKAADPRRLCAGGEVRDGVWAWGPRWEGGGLKGAKRIDTCGAERLLGRWMGRGMREK